MPPTATSSVPVGLLPLTAANSVLVSFLTSDAELVASFTQSGSFLPIATMPRTWPAATKVRTKSSP